MGIAVLTFEFKARYYVEGRVHEEGQQEGVDPPVAEQTPRPPPMEECHLWSGRERGQGWG